MTTTTTYSVRIFDGSYETARYATRAEAEEHVARSQGERINEDGERVPSPPPVIVEVEADLPVCLSCETALVTSKDPVRYPYCKNCHYTGQASTHMRAAQIERFKAAFPDANFIGIEHTGGGCFWLAFYWEDFYYAVTEGEAGLPVDADGNPLPDGGWGALFRYVHDDDAEDYEGTEIVYIPEALEDPSKGLTDEQVIEAIRDDRRRLAHVARMTFRSKRDAS